MNSPRTSRARRFALALAGALALTALAAGSASAFGPLPPRIGTGFPGSGDGQIVEPGGVAVSPDGLVVVADIAMQRVNVFGPDGTFLRAFGTDVSIVEPGSGAEVCTVGCQAGGSGTAAGELSAISDVAAGPDTIYVSEQGNARISAFTYEGRFLRAFGKGVGGPGVDVCDVTCGPGELGGESGTVSAPYAIGLGAGRLYVSDTGNYRVDVFDAASGSFEFAFGKDVGGAGVNTCTTNCAQGTGDVSPGSLTAAYGLAVGPEGNVYTTGPADNKVSVFSSTGQFLRQFGEPGSGAGQLTLPHGLAVDDAGTVYVAEVNTHRLSVFSAAGQFQVAYGRDVIPGPPAIPEACTAICGPGQTGFGRGDLTAPRSVAVDCRGTVYVGSVNMVSRWGEPGAAPPPCPPPTPPAPAPLAKPSNEIKLGKLKLNRRKGTATLVVTVPGPGTLKAKAGKRIRAKAPRPKRAGRVKVTLRAKGKGVKALGRSGRLKGTLRLTYRPSGGDARTVTRKLTLVKTGYSRKASADSKRR